MGLPVTVVAGLAGTGKSALIEGWRTRALAPAALVIDRGEDFKFPRAQASPASEDPGVERIGGCACCTAGVALGGALRKLMRRGAWAHLMVDLNGGAHPAAFIDTLRASERSGALRLVELVAVIDAARLSQRLAGAQRRWLVEQVRSAHRVVLFASGTQPHAEIEAQATALLALGGQGGFAPELAIWREGEPPPAPSAGLAPLASRSDGPVAAGTPGSGVTVQLQAIPAGLGWRWLWRAPPDRVFERTQLVEVLGGWLDASQRVEAVLRTERDWYRFQASGHEPDLWRRDSRVQVTVSAGELAGLQASLRMLADRLRACEKRS